MTEQHHEAGHDPAAVFKAYITIFVALCAFTIVSFACNTMVRGGIMSPLVSLTIIMAVAVAKAGCVAVIFMHLKWDWGKVYCIMVPVLIMSVMMVIVLLPDGILAWPKN